MSRPYVKNIALLMIFLIVMLPINSSVLFAATISSVQAHGKAEIPGYRAAADSTTVVVSAKIPEDADISTGQVKILEDPTRPFECAIADEATQSYDCVCEYPEMTLPPAIGVMPFTIQIFNDAGAPISAAATGAITVDSKGPTIVSVRYAPKPGGLVEAEYTVKDEACSKPECANKCSGVADVRFTVAGLSVGQGSLTGELCTQTGKTNLTGLTAGSEVVTKNICIEAFDRLGQSGSKCEDVVIDVRPPAITGIGLFDINGKPVKYTNGQPIGNVKIVVNITEDSKLVNPRNTESVENTIYVNASSLSERPEHQAAFGNLKLLCRSLGDNAYTCEFGGLFVIASAQRDISVKVEGRDEFGNVLDETRLLSVMFDNTPPVATRIYSNYLDDKGNYWIDKENNTIFMDITEIGSGMSNRYAFLDFSGFGPQDVAREGTTINLLAPNECVEGWTCKWHRIKTDKADNSVLYISPQAGSRDDANNGMNSVTGTFHVDKTGPVVIAELSNMTGSGEGHAVMTNLTGGDMVSIHMFVKDFSGLKDKKAVANLSGIMLDASDAVETDCFENQVIANASERIFECVWEAGPIKDGYLGPESGNAPSIYFTFTDNVNHTVTHAWSDIEILARENVTTPTWKVYVVPPYSPKDGLDRLTWKLSQPRMYYHIKFEALRGDPVPISIQLDGQSCTALEYVNVDPLTNQVAITLMGYPMYELRPSPPFEDIVTIGFNPDSVPEVETRLPDNSTVPFEGFDINCSMTITSIVSSSSPTLARALTLPEQVNISFHVPVYSNPLGQNIGDIRDEIKDMQDYIEDFEFLTILRQIFEVAQQVCNMLNTLIQIDAMMGMAKDIFQGLCNTPAQGAGCSMNEAMGSTMNKDSIFIPDLLKDVYYFCGLFISCRMSSEEAEHHCEGSTDKWCSVQKTWAGITSWYSELFSNKIFSLGLSTAQSGGVQVFDIRGSFDPKQSLYSSILSLCLPGIIVNLEKFVQIYCKKIMCYKVDVAMGRPVWRCDQEYDYLICTTCVGWAFAALPVVQFVSQIGDMISGFIKNPYTIIGYAVDLTANLVCSCDSTGCATTCSVFRALQWLETAANIVADLVESTSDRFSMATYDVCSEALKDEPDYANINPPVSDTGVGGT